MAKPEKPVDDGRTAEVEWTDCPACEAPAGSACRTAGGATAFRYHTARFILVPALQGQAEVLVPEDRRPGTPWQSPESSGAGRFGYAAIGADPPEVRDQIEALRAAGCTRIFVDQTDPLAVTRPELVRALSVAGDAAREARDGAVIVTVHELRRLARTSRELITLAAGAQRDGVRIEVLTGPLAGVHGHGPGDPQPTLFTVLAAAGNLDREHGRHRLLAGQRAAAAAGRRSGRPKVFDDDLLAEARRLRAAGIPVPEIAARLVITAGKNAGSHPSTASVYRALADDDLG